MTSVAREVRLRKHEHGVTMSLFASRCRTRGGMETGAETESEDQRREWENKQKADEDARRAEAPPPPFRPLGEQSFMQFMQFMQESQNKFMHELVQHVVPAKRTRDPRGKSLGVSEDEAITFCHST